jgi:hypothetical protein
MSMANCLYCHWYIDTDEDPASCVEDEFICENCRFDLVVEGELIETDAGLKWAPPEDPLSISPITSYPVQINMAAFTEQEIRWIEEGDRE